MKHACGSEWRKWDLHVHSPLSMLNNQYPKKSDGSPDWDKYIDKLEAIKDISVVGITDYFFIDGYKELLEKRKQGRLKNFDLLLPNVELRLDTFVVQDVSKDINFHIIFSDELKPEVIEKEFIEALDIQVSGSVSGTKGIRKLSKGSLEALGEEIRKHNKSFEKYSNLHAAFENITVSLKQVQDLLGRKIFDSKFVFVLAGSEWADIDWKQAYLTKKNLLQAAHMLETGSPGTRAWALGEKDISKKEFIKEFGALKASIFGSDAHTLDKICNPPDDKYCWIKADPTFEGLRQIIFEPKHRVRISKEAPLPPLHRIKNAVFDFPNGSKIGDDTFCLNGRSELSFSPNLTCIIGGRGTGKSTILNLIYEKLNPGIKSSEIISKIKIDNGKTLEECVKIDNDEEEKYVEFLSQNEIEEFATDHKKFTKAIYQRIGKLDDEGKIVACEKKVYEEIENVQQQINNIQQKVTKEQTLQKKTKELLANNRLMASLKSEEYKTISVELNKFNTDRRRIEQAEKKYLNLTKELEKIQTGYEENKGNDKNIYELKYNQILRIIKKITTTCKTIDFKAIVALKQEIVKKIEDNQNKLREYLKSQDLSEEDLNDIAGANKRISELSDEIEILKKEVAELIKQIDDFKIKNLIDSKNAYDKEVRKQIAPVSKQLETLEGEVKPISLICEFYEVDANNALLREFEQVFATEDVEIPKIDVLADYLFKQKPLEVSDKEEFLKKIIDNKELHLIKTQKYLLGLFESDTNFLIYKLLIQKIYADLKKFLYIRVLYDKKPLKDSSFGQRCTAAIVVLLLLGNNPIMIDEPEAHLDSALISKYLVGVIKDNKKNRQIIFATHNANFVINGDAELIHCLDMKNKITNVVSITIENLEHREKLLKLEGGEAAFKQRGEKYNCRI